MFFRQKRSGKHIYLQIVENRWEEGRSKQRVIATLGRLDELREQGRLDGLLRSGAKLSQAAILLTAQQKGELPVVSTTRLGPELIFQRLWSELKIPHVLEGLLGGRRFEFPVERAVFLTVMHRLFHSGSDRSCMVWKEDYHLPGTESLQLHQQFPLAAGTLKNSVFLVFAFVNIDGRIPGGSLAISVCQQSGWIPRSGGICHGQEGRRKKGCQEGGTHTKKRQTGQPTSRSVRRCPVCHCP